ncbi:MAG: hypothetical protein ACLUR5_15315 [Eubacterium ventriosum]
MKMPKQTMTFITFLLRKFIHSLMANNVVSLKKLYKEVSYS